MSWSCPRCGARLLVKNLSHSCGDHSIARFLEGKSERGRDLFERFAALIARCGPYDVAPAKTRVAFMADVRFASVNRIGADGAIDVHFVLPRAVASPRIRRVEQLGKLHVHHLRISHRRELDRELAGWLRQSYLEYGKRGWLADRRASRRSDRGRRRTDR